MEYGLIGNPLTHSFSPELHRQLAGYDYQLCPLEPEGLEAFFEKRAFRGINVTIPYKQAVIPLLDELDAPARAIGAVNTVVNENGRLIGHNTDYAGMAALIHRTGLSLEGKTVLILGTGGTSRTAAALAQNSGAAGVYRVSRRTQEGCITYAQASLLPAQIIINTTPCGMDPHPETQAMDLACFSALEGVIDAVYHPLRTRLVLQARMLGAKSDGGLYMLTAQAASAAEWFLGHPLPDDHLEKVFRNLRASKENIVLIGMPGSGKSTVGKLLSAATDRPFIDLDEEVVRREGRSIPQIFSEQGEPGFREIESRIAADCSRKTGAVISTGGGVILREENLTALRQNGRLYFLDRPLPLLLPSEDRPLSQTDDALRQRYEERYDLYCAAADVHVTDVGSEEAAANAIREEFFA